MPNFGLFIFSCFIFLTLLQKPVFSEDAYLPITQIGNSDDLCTGIQVAPGPTDQTFLLRASYPDISLGNEFKCSTPRENGFVAIVDLSGKPLPGLEVRPNCDRGMVLSKTGDRFLCMQDLTNAPGHARDDLRLQVYEARTLNVLVAQEWNRKPFLDAFSFSDKGNVIISVDTLGHRYELWDLQKNEIGPIVQTDLDGYNYLDFVGMNEERGEIAFRASSKVHSEDESAEPAFASYVTRAGTPQTIARKDGANSANWDPETGYFYYVKEAASKTSPSFSVMRWSGRNPDSEEQELYRSSIQIGLRAKLAGNLLYIGDDRDPWRRKEPFTPMIYDFEKHVRVQDMSNDYVFMSWGQGRYFSQEILRGNGSEVTGRAQIFALSRLRSAVSLVGGIASATAKGPTVGLDSLAGLYQLDPGKSDAFCAKWSVGGYATVDVQGTLDNPSVGIIPTDATQKAEYGDFGDYISLSDINQPQKVSKGTDWISYTDREQTTFDGRALRWKSSRHEGFLFGSNTIELATEAIDNLKLSRTHLGVNLEGTASMHCYFRRKR